MPGASPAPPPLPAPAAPGRWTWRDAVCALLAGPAVARRRHRAAAEQHAAAEAARARVAQLAAEREALRAERDALHHERGEQAARAQRLETRLTELASERGELAAARDTLRKNSHATIVNLSLRSLTLVERQLGVLEGLESTEEDPDALDSLFTLDHLATRMRRNSENVLVLADASSANAGSRQHEPVPLLDALRAAVSEIEHYDRVDVQFLPRIALLGRCADDIAHLFAELLENAAAFSPPHEEVAVSGWLVDASAGGRGEVMLCIEDRGIGVAPERMAEMNAQLAAGATGRSVGDVASSRSMGLFVVARLAHRHGVRVQLREAPQGGVTAVVVLPAVLIAGEEPPGPARAPSAPDAFAGGAVAGPPPAAAPSADRPPSGAIPPVRTAPDDLPAGRAPSDGPYVDGPYTGGRYPDGPAPHPDAGRDRTAPGGTGGLPRRVPMAQHVPGSLPGPDPAADAEADLYPDPGIQPGPGYPGSGPAGGPRPGPGAPHSPFGSGPVGGGLTGGPVPARPPAPSDGGLPVRRPGTARRGAETEAPAAPAAPAPAPPSPAAAPPSPAAAEELRRRLGGFQQGLATGRRDAEHAEPAPPPAPYGPEHPAYPPPPPGAAGPDAPGTWPDGPEPAGGAAEWSRPYGGSEPHANGEGPR